MEDSFLLFLVVGFLAQLVDGALGMAYGVVSSTVLLSFGVTPAAASASVHADGAVLKPFVEAYLSFMGLYILYRAFRDAPTVRHHPASVVAPMGLVGGAMDAVGGGGWGPVVTTGLVGSGGSPREVIGTVNTAEFLLTVAVSAAFLSAFLTGHWNEAEGLSQYAWAVGGLIVGGVAAAPLAGYVTRYLAPRHLMIAVGTLITLVAAYQVWRLL